MDIVDLFCGGGGSSTGFHQAGFTTKYAVDTAWHARETFKANHGNVVHNKDISKLRSEPILDSLDGSRPAIVTASPPCEPFTVANNKRVNDPFYRLFDDKVGRLMIHAIRLIADLQPEYYFIENVRGILDGDGEELLREEMIDLGLEEPHFHWVEASKWGVPSHRLRIIISNLKLENPNVEQKTVRDAIDDLPPPNYPTGHDFHYSSYLTTKHKDDIITQRPGEGLVYFYGANKDYQNYTRLFYDEPASVVMGKSRFVHPVEDRILTPLEHARLMTFPDDYKYIGTTSQIYDVIGEAVPPKLTYQFGKQVLAHL